MKKYAKLLPLMLIMCPLVVLAIGGTKRIIDLPGFTTDRLLFVDANNELQDTGITVGGSDDTLSGIASLNGITSTTLGYVDFTSSGQTQLDAKLDDFSSTTDNALVRTDGTSGAAVQDSGITVSDLDAMSGATQIDIISQGELRLQDTAGGQYLGFRSPTTLSGSQTFTLPDGDGSNGEALITNGSGTLSWSNVSADSVPTGTMLWYGSGTAPTGYLNGDGSAVSRTTYSSLYAVFGDAFGEGNGTTTFNLPDCRGYFVRGFDNTAGNDPNSGTRTAMATGGNTGDAIGSIQADATALPTNSFSTGTNIGDHTHGVSIASAAGGSAVFPAPGNGADSGSDSTTTTVSSNHSHNVTGGGDSETRPLNFYMNCIIKI